jgi:hypothetical protein
MANNFIPAQDPQALIWMQTFSAGISANPSLYLLSAPDAVSIASAVNGFDVALAASSDPATRTAVTVAEKDEARISAEQICRQYAILIKYNAGVSDPDKIAIGVRPVNPNREPINCPQTSPLLSVIAATPGVQTLRYADSTTPDSAKKPFGATELQLFRAIAPPSTPITDPGAASFYGKFTRNPVGVEFDAADNGKQATYFARWASRRGQTGPWSAPISLAIAA